MTKALPVPDWLTLRAGSLKPGVRPETQFVLIGDQPLYKLEVRPATGKFTCAISNTVNGKRLDDGTTVYPGAQEAFAGGLEQLRAKLGW
ncbi:MAG TPA: hypothetical protein VG122_11110 [Gemmata sp.]|jgi:hypothetical protein|nr:hypothetical protein [Gemmata sp.]